MMLPTLQRARMKKTQVRQRAFLGPLIIVCSAPSASMTVERREGSSCRRHITTQQRGGLKGPPKLPLDPPSRIQAEIPRLMRHPSKKESHGLNRPWSVALRMLRTYRNGPFPLHLIYIKSMLFIASPRLDINILKWGGQERRGTSTCWPEQPGEGGPWSGIYPPALQPTQGKVRRLQSMSTNGYSSSKRGSLLSFPPSAQSAGLNDSPLRTGRIKQNSQCVTSETRS